uniref:Putative cytoplasm n=1 Tax=Corethrella appendiculata TaxID=1370023 RepID=U5ERA1_9DIPT
MSTPVRVKLELPKAKVLTKNRLSVFQRLGTKKLSTAPKSTSIDTQQSVLEAVRQITLPSPEPEPIEEEIPEPPPPPPPKKIPERAQKAADAINSAILSRQTNSPSVTVATAVTTTSTNQEIIATASSITAETISTSSTSIQIQTNSTSNSKHHHHHHQHHQYQPEPQTNWDQSSLENADQDLLEKKRLELQQELKLQLEMDASSKKKEAVLLRRTKKIARSSTSSDSTSSSGSDSSSDDSSSSTSTSSRESRRKKIKRGMRPRRDSSSSSDHTKKKKHLKKMSGEAAKKMSQAKKAAHLAARARMKKQCAIAGSPSVGHVSRKMIRSSVSPTSQKVAAKLAMKSKLMKKEKMHLLDAREQRAREKERELQLREKEKLHYRSKSPTRYRSSRSPRRRSPSSPQRREMKKKSPERRMASSPPRYDSKRRRDRSDERSVDRTTSGRSAKELQMRRHEEERRARLAEREAARNKERAEALARCQARQRERERIAAEKQRLLREREGNVGGLEKPDKHRPVERLLPRPADRARALAAARSPRKSLERGRSRSPRSYDKVRSDRGAYIDHGDRQTRNDPETRTRDYRVRRDESPYERQPREYREEDHGYEEHVPTRSDRRHTHDYSSRGEYDNQRRHDGESEWREQPSTSSSRYDRSDHSQADWDRGAVAHEADAYQNTQRDWNEHQWGEGDQTGWRPKDKDRADWKRSNWNDQHHEEHMQGGPPPPPQHVQHPPRHRWQPPSGGPIDQQHPMEYHPRQKMVPKEMMGGERPMYRRHNPHHPGAMFHPRKPHMQMQPNRFPTPNKYSLNRTQTGQQIYTPRGQHVMMRHVMMTVGDPQPQIISHQLPTQQIDTMSKNLPSVGGVKDESSSITLVQPQAIQQLSQQQQSTVVAAAANTNTTTIITTQTPPQTMVTPPTEDEASKQEHQMTSTDQSTLNPQHQQPEEEADDDEKNQQEIQSNDAVAATQQQQQPNDDNEEDEDNLSEISDDPDEILTREEENVEQAQDQTEFTDDQQQTQIPQALTQQSQLAAGTNLELQNQDSNLNEQLDNDVNAAKLHANKELKEEMDLDFEEISDGELEEETKFKVGDALGVDWASLVEESRRLANQKHNLKTMPISARKRWRSHHILLDIGISVKYAGEQFAKDTILQAKQKLKQELEELKQVKKETIKNSANAFDQNCFGGVKIKQEKLDEDEQAAAAAATMKLEPKCEEKPEIELDLNENELLTHPVADIQVSLREKIEQRKNLIMNATGQYSRALSARRDLQIRRQLCGFPIKENYERAELQNTPVSSELQEMALKLFQRTIQNKIKVQ